MDASTRPTGTVTFLFSDVEGSTELATQLGVATYRDVMERHQRLLRSAFRTHGGLEQGAEGDSFFVVFRDARSAVAAAVEAQRALGIAEWPAGVAVRVRMGLHSGEGVPGGDNYIGLDVNRAARIASAAHGGQVLISDSARGLAADSLPTDVALRDLGAHRLRGLPSPVRLHQLVIGGIPSDFPPIRSLDIVAGNIPARLTSLVGRERAVDEIRVLLAEARLVTLVGPGGTGKTALALEVARQMASGFAGGAWFAPLESLADADLVASAIVSALGLRDLSGRAARERLLDNLPGRSILLVVDNFEHVLAAADLLGEILAGAPDTRLLVTSRAPLHLSAEQVYPLPPLSVPERGEPVGLTELQQVPSIRLFIARARRVQPGFALTNENAAAIAEICRRLDGLPLGIELAAAKIALLGPAGIRERLGRQAGLPGSGRPGVPTRQRTLHDTIAWSHDLLDVPGRTLFAQLSVFAGGWRLKEAEAVCGPAAEPGADIFDRLATLADQSLVITRPVPRGTVRFAMLETIREYAAEQLTNGGERPAVARRHAMAFLSMAEEQAPALEGRGAATAIELLEAEDDNLRTAMRWSIDSGQAEIALRLASALWRYWKVRGEMAEGRSTIAAVMAMPGADLPTRWRMQALEAAGGLAYYSGDHEAAREAYLGQLARARQLDDRHGAADARFNLAFTDFVPEERAKGLATLDEIAAEYQALGDERSVARTQWARGAYLLSDGRADDAIDNWHAAMAKYEEFDDAAYRSLTAASLALASFQLGDHATAARWFIAGMAATLQVGDVALLTIGLTTAALAALGLGQPEAAATILGAYEVLRARYGVQPPRGLVDVIKDQNPLGRAREALDPTSFDAAFRRGQEMSLEEVVTYALELRPVATSDALHHP